MFTWWWWWVRFFSIMTEVATNLPQKSRDKMKCHTTAAFSRSPDLLMLFYRWLILNLCSFIAKLEAVKWITWRAKFVPSHNPKHKMKSLILLVRNECQSGVGEDQNKAKRTLSSRTEKWQQWKLMVWWGWVLEVFMGPSGKTPEPLPEPNERTLIPSPKKRLATKGTDTQSFNEQLLFQLCSSFWQRRTHFSCSSVHAPCITSKSTFSLAVIRLHLMLSGGRESAWIHWGIRYIDTQLEAVPQDLTRLHRIKFGPDETRGPRLGLGSEETKWTCENFDCVFVIFFWTPSGQTLTDALNKSVAVIF